jgi:hypothetical protein
LNRIKELTEQFYEKKYTCLIADPEKIIRKQKDFLYIDMATTSVR